jgi:hypothetical protein
VSGHLVSGQSIVYIKCLVSGQPHALLLFAFKFSNEFALKHIFS